jgi:hypothetical protein
VPSSGEKDEGSGCDIATCPWMEWEWYPTPADSNPELGAERNELDGGGANPCNGWPP